jgi:outer membrane lipoprotein-sorting protein
MNTLRREFAMRFTALILLLAFVTAPVRADDKAQAVVNEAIKALGGKELIEKYQCSTSKAKGEMSAMGIDLEFTATLTYAPPEKYKMAMKANFAGQNVNVVQIMNGKKMKSTLNGNALPIDDNEADNIRENMAEHEIARLVPLLNGKVYTLKVGDAAKVGDTDVDVVIVTGGGLKDKDAKLFFDKKTHYMIKMQRKSKEPGTGQEVDEELFMSDYKKVEGVMTAHKYEVKHDGKKYMTMTLSDVTLTEKIDDKEFAIDDE